MPGCQVIFGELIDEFLGTRFKLSAMGAAAWGQPPPLCAPAIVSGREPLLEHGASCSPLSQCDACCRYLNACCFPALPYLPCCSLHAVACCRLLPILLSLSCSPPPDPC